MSPDRIEVSKILSDKNITQIRMHALFKDFGFCIIPKNTILFRGHPNNEFNDCMFFATKPYVAGSFSDSIQIWKTSREITVVFLVENLSSRSWAISSLPRLYNTIFPLQQNVDFDDLDIKHWNTDRRDSLVKRLHNDYNISGWFSSLESKIEVEICLFNTASNSSQLKLIEVTNSRDKRYYKDSLAKIKIFPNKSFYTASETEIGFNNSYTKYKRARNHIIREEAETLHQKTLKRHYYFDLRTKLKI